MSSTGKIRALPDQLINKIAAGEVIERPGSVVKELLDNAIDAEASRISLTIEEGGKQLIRVADNGGGMSPEDLRLCVLPHTTSKLVEEDDLFSIRTMGFRGEALASISAVSKMRVVSRLRGSDEAHEIVVSGKVLESAQAAGSPEGTTVEVRDLFFNVPARRKFLRTNATEVGHINEQVARAALAHPQIAFEVRNNNRVSHNLPACAHRLERIARFYGPELAGELLHVQRLERGVDLEIFAAPPGQSRANANWQYIFLNRRFIRDRYLQHAVKEAYRGLMEPNRYAVVFVFLTLDPETVDVNVHPTKIEVRWSDPNLVHSQVLSALRETFQRCDLSPALRTDRSRTSERDEVRAEQQDELRREAAEVFKFARPLDAESQRHFSYQGPTESGRATGSGPRGGMPNRDAWESFYRPGDPDRMRGVHEGRTEDARSRIGLASGDPAAAAAGEESTQRPRAIQLHNLYLVTETEDGIAIIDQHALHERVMYETLTRRITQGPLESQRLLLPESVSVTAEQMAILEENQELLQRLGIEVAPFGRDSVAVHAFPVLLKDADVVEFMRDLVDRLCTRPTSMSAEEVIHEILDMMACKAAVKAGDPLSDAEIASLLAQRHLVEKSSSCPHGRPTMLRLTKTDLERQFKRT